MRSLTNATEGLTTDSIYYFLFPNSFLFLLVRHLLLEAMHLFLVAYCFYLLFLVSK